MSITRCHLQDAKHYFCLSFVLRKIAGCAYFFWADFENQSCDGRKFVQGVCVGHVLSLDMKVTSRSPGPRAARSLEFSAFSCPFGWGFFLSSINTCSVCDRVSNVNAHRGRHGCGWSKKGVLLCELLRPNEFCPEFGHIRRLPDVPNAQRRGTALTRSGVPSFLSAQFLWHLHFVMGFILGPENHGSRNICSPVTALFEHLLTRAIRSPKFLPPEAKSQNTVFFENFKNRADGARGTRNTCPNGLFPGSPSVFLLENAICQFRTPRFAEIRSLFGRKRTKIEIFGMNNF